MAMSVYVAFCTPYIHQLDNIRVLLYRLIVLGITILWIVIKVNTSGAFIATIPWGILVLLSCGAILNGMYIIWKTIDWFGKSGVKDLEMYTK